MKPAEIKLLEVAQVALLRKLKKVNSIAIAASRPGHSHPVAEVEGLFEALAGKQDALVSGTSLVTINGNSLLAEGDLTIPSGGASVTEITVNFSPARKCKTFVVSVPGAVVGQKIVAVASGEMPAGVSLDELEMDPLIAAAYVSAVDTVTVMVTSLGGPVFGPRNINLMIG